jgi:hypothetical protein
MALIGLSALYSPIPYGGQGGDPVTSLALVDRANRLIGRNASAILRTWIHARYVEDYAASGQAAQSSRSADQAASAFSRVPARLDGFFSNWTENRLTAYRANALVLLHRPGEAIAQAQQALRNTPGSLVGERSFLLIVLGAAHAGSDYDASSTLFFEALRLAQGSGLAERMQRVRGIRRQYQNRWPLSLPVRQLDLQLGLTISR